LSLQQVLDFLGQLGDAEDFLCGAEVEESLTHEKSIKNQSTVARGPLSVADN
jgi:hypothetical protein